MDLVTVRELYKNREAYLDKEVSIGGWVRSVRASKAFGFIVLSATEPILRPFRSFIMTTWHNFAEICKLNVGAAIIVKGTLVATPDAKQPFEIQAVRGCCRRPVRTGLPAAEKAPHPGVPAYHHPSASAHQHLPGCIPRTFPDRIRHPPVLPGA